MKNNMTEYKKRMQAVLATVLVSFLSCVAISAQTPAEWEKLEGDVVLYMANDLGRNGYYDQKPIAELMGVMAETLGPECVIAPGRRRSAPADRDRDWDGRRRSSKPTSPRP